MKLFSVTAVVTVQTTEEGPVCLLRELQISAHVRVTVAWLALITSTCETLWFSGCWCRVVNECSNRVITSPSGDASSSRLWLPLVSSLFDDLKKWALACWLHICGCACAGLKLLALVCHTPPQSLQAVERQRGKGRLFFEFIQKAALLCTHGGTPIAWKEAPWRLKSGNKSLLCTVNGSSAKCTHQSLFTGLWEYYCNCEKSCLFW